MMSTGILVRADTVIAQRAPDGAVELIWLELDLGRDCRRDDQILLSARS